MGKTRGIAVRERRNREEQEPDREEKER
jgi:hypothetical protein